MRSSRLPGHRKMYCSIFHSFLISFFKISRGASSQFSFFGSFFTSFLMVYVYKNEKKNGSKMDQKWELWAPLMSAWRLLHLCCLHPPQLDSKLPQTSRGVREVSESPYLRERHPRGYWDLNARLGVGWLVRLSGHYCTISIDSAWGVSCDAMDEILHMARLRRICDVEKNSVMSLSQACLKNLKLEQKCDLIFWQPKDPLNAPTRPSVTRDRWWNSAKTTRLVMRDGRINRNGTVLFFLTYPFSSLKMI